MAGEFVSDDYSRECGFGTEARLIQLQAQATGFELVQNRTSAEHYEGGFQTRLRRSFVERA